MLFNWRAEKINKNDGWTASKRSVDDFGAFFDSVRYRPRHSSRFDQEKLLVSAALSFANRQYFRSDLAGYRNTVREVGGYLDNAIKTEELDVVGSDVWQDYLHHKATVEHLFGEPSAAACMNIEVKRLCEAKEGRELEAIEAMGCAICCRVESIASDEDYVLTSLESKIEELGEKIKNIPNTQRINNSEEDLQTKAFYIHSLRCKIQAHKKDPDAGYLEKALDDAKACHGKLSKDEALTYEVVIAFYEAFLSKIRKEPISRTKNLYNKAVMAARKSRVQFFCLLNVPDSISADLANHVNEERLIPNQEVRVLKTTLSRRFAVLYFIILLFGFVFPLVLPCPSDLLTALYAVSFAVAGVGLYVCNYIYRNRHPGMLSPGFHTTAELTYALFFAVTVTLLGTAFSDFIHWIG